MAADMKAPGEMICKKVTEMRFGVMGPNILETTVKGKSMVMVFTYGQINLSMKETGSITKLKVSVFIPGLMADNTKAIGLTIICMDKEYTPGKMVGNMMVTT